jgi:uncharacterized protein (DUF2235 family)
MVHFGERDGLMSKNIVVCIDGTWNNSVSDDAPSTNVHNLFLSLERSNQFKIYYPGVGTHRGWLGKRLDGANGKGVFQIARLAWQQVAANFEPGDRIFIFGFSRGAYAARHLASMIVRRGLKGWQGTLEQEFREWLMDVKRIEFPVRANVDFLGLFDCVPGNQLYMLRDRTTQLNSGILENGILHFRHAVSRDERRWSFRPLLFRPSEQLSFAQHWFPGYHSDVGGGTHNASGLASLSLWWMIREAFALGLEFDNINCASHQYGHALGVIRCIDPNEKPITSDYWTTRLGLRWDRKVRERDPLPDDMPRFEELDLCPRCNHEMFDYFLTDVGQRWLRSKRLVRDPNSQDISS